MAYLAVGFSATGCFAAPELTIQVQDYATMPITDTAAGKGMNAVYLSRVNFLYEEPGRNRHRLFVNDLNGPLYILDKKTKAFSTYLNFNGNYGQPGLFHKLTTLRGYANGFISFVFDPDYAPQRQVLYHPSRGSCFAGFSSAGPYAFSWIAHGRLHGNSSHSNTGANAAGSRGDGMD
jgi:hypothetical protein